MPKIIQDLRSVLSVPSIYSLFGVLIGGIRCRRTFVDDHIRPIAGDRVLDIGCGPADIISYLPQVEYVGFDASQEYINAARKKFGDRGKFYCEQVSTEVSNKPFYFDSYFDTVLAIGILHHLNDDEALQLCQLARTALKPGGRLVTFDGCYVKNQSPCAKYLLAKDRGQFVRNQKGYVNIISQVFSNFVVHIHHDLLRIPYTHIILECTK
jgi:SAM-dependent methyltransferase